VTEGFIAYTGPIRLMFFYESTENQFIICTNGYEKGGPQDRAFITCHNLMVEYFKFKTAK
jgi:hypothetical protein